MRIKQFTFRSMLFILLSFFVSHTAKAEDLIVEPNPSAGHFATIQSALDFITSQTGTTTTFRIIVERGTYGTTSGQPIRLLPNVPIVGREAAKTILTGNTAVSIIDANRS